MYFQSYDEVADERIEIDNLKVGTIFLYEPCIQTITVVFILFYFTFFLEYACAIPYHESPSWSLDSLMNAYTFFQAQTQELSPL